MLPFISLFCAGLFIAMVIPEVEGNTQAVEMTLMCISVSLTVIMIPSYIYFWHILQPFWATRKFQSMMSNTVDLMVGCIILLLLILTVMSITGSIISIICDPNVFSIVYNTASILVLSIQLVFFGLMFPKLNTGYLFVDKNISITYIIVFTAQACSWLAGAFGPLLAVSPGEDSNLVNGSRCSLNSSRNEIVHKCSHSLFPAYQLFEAFFVESVALATALLLITWSKTMTTPFTLNDDYSRSFRGNRHQLIFRLVSGLAVTTSVVYCAILIAFEGHDKVYNTLQFCYVLPLNIAVVYLIWNMKNHKHRDSIQLTLIDYIIIIASSFDLVWYFLRFLSGFICVFWDSNITDVAIIIILWTFIALFNTIAQTYLIIELRRIRRLRLPWHCTSLLVFICTYNFAEWVDRIVVVGIARMNSNQISPLLNSLVGIYARRIITVVLFPVMNIYRLFCSLVTLEILYTQN